MIKSIIFDLDGTLLNTVEDIADCNNKVLKELNFPLATVEQYYYFLGNGVIDLVRSSLPEDKQKDECFVNECVVKFKKHYSTGWAVKSKIYDGIDELLCYLNERNIPISVLSNKPHEFAVKVMRHFFNKYNFAEIWGKKESYPIKPAPDAALAIAKRLNCLPEEILFIGDSSNDINTAKNSKFTSMGVTWGFRPEKELRAAEADYIVDHPRKIQEIIEKINSFDLRKN